MIKLIYEPDETLKEFSVDRVVITKEDDEHISDYVIALDTFLRACGFVDGTIDKVLPTRDDIQ